MIGLLVTVGVLLIAYYAWAVHYLHSATAAGRLGITPARAIYWEIKSRLGI